MPTMLDLWEPATLDSIKLPKNTFCSLCNYWFQYIKATTWKLSCLGSVPESRSYHYLIGHPAHSAVAAFRPAVFYSWEFLSMIILSLFNLSSR